jgi:hypothetical protein
LNLRSPLEAREPVRNWMHAPGRPLAPGEVSNHDGAAKLQGGGDASKWYRES